MAKRKKARADGEGSLFQRKDGKWIAQVQFTGADGRRRVKTRQAATQDRARRALTAMRGDADAHRLVVSGKATVGDWLAVWLEEFIRPSRAPRTYVSYHDVIEQHLPDRITKMAIGRLAPEDLQRQFNAIATEGHARTADLLRAVLRSAFNKAVKLRRMANNPVLATDPVRYTQKEMATFTTEEAIRFLQAAENDRLGALFTIALSLGLRKGEASGLKPEDVDLEGRELHVRRSLQWRRLPARSQVKVPGEWIEREPKRGSKRDLPMTEMIYRALVRHIASRQEEAGAAKEWRDSGYLFVNISGTPLHDRNLTEMFHKLCDAAKVPRIRFHDTRHTCGTLLHAQGADPFIIQKVLGHSQLSTTRRYVHVPVEVTRPAVTGLESLFEGARKTQEDKLKAIQPHPKLVQ